MKEKKNIEIVRHSLSHIMAAAVLEMFPEGKLAIGPSIENGFYYDFDLPRTLIPEDLPLIQNKMEELIKKNLKFERAEAPIEKALEEAKKLKQIYKAELIEDLMKQGETTVSFYRTGNFVDLCAGPHIDSTKGIDPSSFILSSIAGAYWRGSEKNKMLQRIYAFAFDTKEELKSYLELIEEAKKRDHRKLGQELDLFSFNDVGPGFPFWHNKGMIFKNLLTEYWRKEHKKHGYQEISTPIILREELWHQSGHWDNYKNNMYFTEIDEQQYAVKPMNCPGGIQVYKTKLHSYREFPLRVAELGLVHRHELSGVLHGLFRVRSFTQDDAHIYCTENQVQYELMSVIKLIEEMYKKFGFTDYHVELSTRPKKSIGSDEMWKKAEETMEKVAKDLKLKYVVNPGDGAFYGPKFDFHIKDSIGRTWQCGTIQLDFSIPERFDLEYVDDKGDRKRPVMIHRTVFGSLERFIGILLEHYAGALPVWLSPIQARIITVNDNPETLLHAINKVAKPLYDAGVRVQIHHKDFVSSLVGIESKDYIHNETIGKKIREAEMQKIPYMIVIGDKEVQSETGEISVRSYKDGDLGQILVEDLANKINEDEK
jgi:threonyl-tRNA synthetase